MKKSLLIGILILSMMVSLLAGCDEKPQTENNTPAPIRVREVFDNDGAIEQDLKLCKQALEDIQGHESISIRKEARIWGNDGDTQTISTYFVKSGQDYYQEKIFPQSGVLDGIPVWESRDRTVRKDDEYYNDSYDGYVIKADTEFEHHFGKSTMTQDQNEQTISVPWLLRYRWKDQDIQYLSGVSNQGNRTIQIQIQGTVYSDTEGESYTAAFIFKDNQLERVELASAYRIHQQQNGKDVVLWTDETAAEYVTSTDTDSIHAKMDEIYQIVLDDVKNRPSNRNDIGE